MQQAMATCQATLPAYAGHNYIYNQFWQLTTEAEANPTDFSYDANGNIASRADALGRRSR